MSNDIKLPERPPRRFLGEEFELSDWRSLEPFYRELEERTLHNSEELKKWMADRSELESYLSENFAWRYIRQTCDTANEKLVEELQYFITEIQPNLASFSNRLDKKVMESGFLGELTDPGYNITLRSMRKEIEIFREENIPLQTEAQTAERKFGAIAGAMTVNLDGEEMTLQKAGDRLQSTDRNDRETAWNAISERRFRDHLALDELLDTLVRLRHKIGVNAGFQNYRDYMFAAMGRFDYKPEDCFNFHESVRESVVPMVNELAGTRKQKLKLSALRPWDQKVDVEGRQALKPFDGGDDLLERTIRCFDRLDGFLGDCLKIMKEMKHLDLESRKGKAPGGYNYPLAEIGVPFIFMNATSNLRDMVTMLHEGGHAVHSFLTRDLTLNTFKNPPAEVAELASMTMELLTMDYWDEFFQNGEELQRAKRQHLESILETLPWVATVDKFQHWLYENPQHTHEQRRKAWDQIFLEFSDNVTDWRRLEKYRQHAWQRQIHIFEYPFYYIEYGIAQLGAIAIWKNYRKDKKKGLDGYLAALKLGYTAPIGEIYQAAGINLDFSGPYIAELMGFVKAELESL